MQHTLCLMHSQFRCGQCKVIVADKAKSSIVCSVLGKGLLPSLDYAAERLITPGARVVPAAIQVKGLCRRPALFLFGSQTLNRKNAETAKTLTPTTYQTTLTKLKV